MGATVVESGLTMSSQPLSLPESGVAAGRANPLPVVGLARGFCIHGRCIARSGAIPGGVARNVSGLGACVQQEMGPSRIGIIPGYQPARRQEIFYLY